MKLRSNCRTASTSAFTVADWQSGGAGGLNSSALVSRIGFQLGMAALPGLVPTHMHGPVGIVPVEMNWIGRLALGRKVVEASAQRDLRRFWNYVLGEKLAGPLEEPLAGDTANPVIDAAREVRDLIERSFVQLAA